MSLAVLLVQIVLALVFELVVQASPLLKSSSDEFNTDMSHSSSARNTPGLISRSTTECTLTDEQ